MSESAFRRSIYLNGFILGFVLMGFEMLGSRYLNPWFGSGIYTWAALISVTLFALTVGYFIGGALVDRRPSAGLLGGIIFLSALSMAVLPLPMADAARPEMETLADWLILAVGDIFGEGPVGVTAAAFALIFVPITLIACYSPFAVRLLLVSTAASGRQTGAVYGINTFGNILGTLATSFWLIPTVGSRAITLGFAAVTAACAVALIVTGMRRS